MSSENGYEGNKITVNYNPPDDQSWVIEFLIIFVTTAFLDLQFAGWIAMGMVAWRLWHV